MTELYRHIGADVDVPAGDISVGGREIGYMFSQLQAHHQRIHRRPSPAKGLEWGGSLIRTGGDRLAAVYFLANMLATRKWIFRWQNGGHLRLGQCRDPCGGKDRPARQRC